MKAFLKKHALIFVVTGVFFICYLTVLLIKHNFQFQTFGLDLGFYDQIIYKASNGSFTKSTIAEVLDRNYFLSFFENDFHLTLLLIAGFYKIVASIYWVFIFQALFSALIGLLIYFAAFTKTTSRLFAIAVSFAVLFSVPYQHVIFDGFTPEVFGAFFIALLFLGLFSKRNRLIYLSIIGMIVSKVEFSPLLALIGLIVFVFEKRYKFGLTIFLIGIFSFVGLVYLLNPLISPHYQNYAHLTLGYGQIGQNPQQVIVNIATKPLYVFEAVITPRIKLNYLFQQFFSFGFLPIGGVAVWPLMAFEFFTRMGNNVMTAKWPLHSYTISVTLAIGTIYFGSLFHKSKKLFWLSTYLISITLLGDIVFHGPMNSFLKPSFYENAAWAKNNIELIAKVPGKASVSANNSLVPHLSQRDKIYIFPNIADAEYIVLDLQNRPNSYTPGTFDKSYNIAMNLIKNKEFQIIFQKENALLLKRI